MIERLYIDGILMDLGDDTDIVLSLKSNLLSDVTKISGNTTYTIKLPRTMHNVRAFGYADKLDNHEAKAYRKHSARFYRNGVEIFADAEAVLMSASSEGLEVSITWGCRPKFTALVERGMTLRELSSNASVLFVEQPTTMTYDEFMQQGYGYVRYDPYWSGEETTEWKGQGGFKEWDGVAASVDIPLPGDAKTGTGKKNGGRIFYVPKHLHPCVSASWVLQRITADTGVTFSWSGDAAQTIGKLAMPCVTKDSNELTYQGQGLTATVSRMPRRWNNAIEMDASADDAVFGVVSGVVSSLTVLADADLMIAADFLCFHTYDQIFIRYDSIEAAYTLQPVPSIRSTKIEIVVRHTDNSEDTYRIGVDQWQRCDNLYEVVPHAGLVERLRGSGIISVQQGDTVLLRNSWVDCEYGDWMTLTGSISMAATDGNEVPYNAYFPIIQNLPDIKVMDFIKFLAAITGTFPKQKSNADVVEFVPYDIIETNAANAVDWSHRLIPATGANVAKETSYRLSDWAQHNIYKWKADEMTMGGYDGDLVIDDTTMPMTRDVITFPFAASDKGNIMDFASVPLYAVIHDYNDQGELVTSYEFGKVEPRILTVYGSGSTPAHLEFDLNMQEIIGERYGVLARAMNGAKVITEEVSLTDRELGEFDETCPVWLAQYGSYFAVLEIKSGSDGVADVTMIKLNLES